MGLEKCKHNMHGRLFLNKGDKPYTTKEITKKLSQHWKTKGLWHMISLGSGFYEFSFSSDDDLRASLAMGTDFNKYSWCLTHAHVWIRLLDLPQEYCLERTLLETTGAFGTPLIIDAATQKRTFGHYARVLVDINFSRRFFYEIMVEREGFSRTVIGCFRKKDLKLDRDNTKKVHDKGKKAIIQHKAQTKKWHTHENPLGIGSFMAFEKLVINYEVTAPAASLEQSLKHHIESSLAFSKPASEITTPVAATDQPPEQHVSPTVVAPVDTYVAQSETCPEALPLDSSIHAHSDKSAFTYHLALENVTDDVIRSNDVESTSILDPVLQLQYVSIPLRSMFINLRRGSNAQLDSNTLVVAVAGNSPAIQSHPFFGYLIGYQLGLPNFCFP
ncbi:DUF4283 domain protein [Medicago truncatula]|uniref:DUF4283 domain protein n=1 Tax=Medicago truncatula TaxID=3880 RepID=G7L7S2_MEDTR|nr:DUF4283 domain protein [Medicago truncatula]